ncbi:MAG TPA: L,D-transpeptidase family protein [Gemmatimonadaceae bacterium]|nr:L,D-transpeptidase family protein [Gemmatimonadaceae bacterium]
MMVVVSIALAAACNGESGGGGLSNGDEVWAPAKLTSVAGVPEAEIEKALRARLAGAPPARIDDHKWAHAKRLYKMYGDNPLWLAEDGLHTERAFALTNALLNTESDGMRMDSYPIGELATAIAAIKGQKPTAEQLVNAEVLLTSAFVALGVDYLGGQVKPKSVSQNWHIDAHDENEDSALVRSIRNPALDKALATMRPTDEDYLGLMKELARYRAIVAKGGWPTVPEGKALKAGDSDSPARLSALRTRLAAEGFGAPAAAATPADSAASASGGGTRPAPAAGSGVYDPALAAAVAAFQARHGIVVDSALGAETVKSLNLPAAYRLQQIAANLERYRWLPRAFGARYVAVNVPAFRLEAFDGGRKTLEMKVIVGEDYEDKATPVFADSMEFVVFRPYWNVTPDIAAKEIFPKLASNPGYLAANDMETYREGGATRIRQRPGPKNSLGLVKFLFPNDFNIYFHDTPFGELFKEDVRAFSHGCIRLEKPELLAQYALGWDVERIREAMENGSNNRTIKVPQKIPVYIIYATTYIRNGQLHFGNDLYQRDEGLAPAVAEGAMPSPQTRQAVEALRRIAATT